ncbi:MAG: glycyl-radical enzyme activating protein [Thermodesulfobacteriota bacterium]|nr:glycyl-radical enzyme activating protein [Thermodesulfobacteriota bacterium]
MSGESIKGLIYNIQGYSIHDGPGIRTTVFMKGCPLKCKWCSNPESTNAFPEILHIQGKCVKCYRCAETCTYGAISIPRKGEFIRINRAVCSECQEHLCAKGCFQGALEIAGRYITQDELLQEVLKDSLFYRNSGGGVTLSGGEALYQHEFAFQFLKKCGEKGIHTVLDTSGQAPWEIIRDILNYTDIVFFDVKHMDPAVHKRLTGVSNEQILKNLEATALLAIVPIIIRIPVIPGHNDSKKNMEDTARFIRKLGIKEVNLLPYHRLGMSKYKGLGRKYPLGEDIIPPNDTDMERIRGIFVSYNLRCSMGAE